MIEKELCQSSLRRGEKVQNLHEASSLHNNTWQFAFGDKILKVAALNH